MENNQDDGKPYYVIRFIEVPFEGINNYVCVPYSWIVKRSLIDQMVVVAYPNNEHHFDTRDRVKRKEKHNEKWKCYMAEIKYITEIHRDAEYWIAAQNYYGPRVEKDSRVKAAQPTPTFKSKLPSSSRSHSSKSTTDRPKLIPTNIKNLQKLPAEIITLKWAAQSKIAEQLDKKRRMQNKAARPSGSTNSYINIGPECSKRERSTVIEECDQTEAAAALSRMSKSTRDRPKLTLTNIKNLQKLPAEIIALKRATQSKAAEQLDEERRIQNKAAQPSGSTSININIGPECSKEERTTVIGECKQTEASAASSSDKPTPSQFTNEKRHQSSRVRQAKKQLPSMPIIDDGGPTEVMIIDKQGHLQDERLPSEANSNGHSQRASNMTTASIAPPQPPTSVQQPPHADHHARRIHSQDRENSHSNFKPIITEVPSIKEIDNNQTSRIDRISSNELHASHHLPSSLKMSSRLYGQMYERPPLIPMHEPVETRNVAIAARNPSNLMNHRSSSPPETQEPTVAQNSSLNISDFRIKIEKSSDSNALDPKVVLKNEDYDAPGIQQTQSVSHERPSFVKQTNKRRQSPPVEQCQQPLMDVLGTLQRLSGSHSFCQIANLEEILMHEASTVQHFPNPAASQPNPGTPQSYQNNPDIFHQKQRQELRRTPTERINRARPTHSGIKVSKLPCHLISKNIANQTDLSSNSLQQGQPPQYMQQQSRPSEPQVGIPTNASSDKRLSTVQGATQRSPPHVQPSILDSKRQSLMNTYTDFYLQLQRLEAELRRKPIDHGPGSKVLSQNIIPVATGEVHSLKRPSFPTDKCIEADLHLYPLSYDQSSSLDPEVDVDCGVIPRQKTFTNNADCEGTSGEQSSAPVNNASPKIILENNVAPRVLPLNEENQSRATKRNSSSHNQYSSRVDKEPPNKKRMIRMKIVLPTEYDPNDSEWTLKYRKLVPDLKELLPGTGIYVNSTKLMHAERVSGDCKTLAPRVLEEVFNETALVVCSTRNEMMSPTSCWIERPSLDPAAWDALFNYVIRYGCLHDWKIDTREIIKAMDHKIYEIRVKHDVLIEPYSP